MIKHCIHHQSIVVTVTGWAIIHLEVAEGRGLLIWPKIIIRLFSGQVVLEPPLGIFRFYSQGINGWWARQQSLVVNHGVSIGRNWLVAYPCRSENIDCKHWAEDWYYALPTANQYTYVMLFVIVRLFHIHVGYLIMFTNHKLLHIMNFWASQPHLPGSPFTKWMTRLLLLGREKYLIMIISQKWLVSKQDKDGDLGADLLVVISKMSLYAFA